MYLFGVFAMEHWSYFEAPWSRLIFRLSDISYESQCDGTGEWNVPTLFIISLLGITRQ